MLYKTTTAILYRGDRIERNTEIDLDPEVAANYADDLVLVAGQAEPEPAAGEETAVDDMTLAQLKEKATALGLTTNGSKADLIERIKLNDGAEPEVEEEGA